MKLKTICFICMTQIDMYNGVYWFEVTINGAIPKSILELKEWLDLI
jgi:hypothetical protein